jgi:diketogulonate reductase-like aldo/keto reductase
VVDDEPDELFAHKLRPKSEGQEGVTDQILYNLTQRGPELDLRPWLAEPQLPVRAGSPVEQGRLLPNRSRQQVATRWSVTPAQVALA